LFDSYLITFKQRIKCARYHPHLSLTHSHVWVWVTDNFTVYVSLLKLFFLKHTQSSITAKVSGQKQRIKCAWYAHSSLVQIPSERWLHFIAFGPIFFVQFTFWQILNENKKIEPFYNLYSVQLSERLAWGPIMGPSWNPLTITVLWYRGVSLSYHRWWKRSFWCIGINYSLYKFNTYTFFLFK